MSDSFPSNSNKLNISCNITIVNSEFNSGIVNKLISTTEKRLQEISDVNLTKIAVPGAYEIPFVVKKIMEQKRTDAIICLGAIIRGETTHYELISVNGILTTENINQAEERIKNGIYFADSCIRMINVNKDLT